MSARAEKLCAALIVAASFVLFSLYSILTPLFEASDELWHYPMVQHLATGGGLPVQRAGQTDAEAPWRQEGSQPPLYYWIAAAFSAPFDSSNWREIRRINPHSDMGVPTRDGNANVVLHTPAEAWPWQRAALAVRAARLASILMSTTTVFFAYLVARELFPNDAGRKTQDATLLRLASPLIVACTPMFAFISGAINNDNAAVLFSTIGIWWALRLMRLGDLSIRNAAIAGAITGLGALSKSSALGLVGLFGLAGLLTIFDARRETQHASRSLIFRLASFVLVMLAVTLLISGWWFIRNQQLYGDLLGWNAFLDVVGRRDQPASLAQLWSEREGFVWAYWGVFGAMNVIMPPWIYDALNALAALAVVGLVLRLASAVMGKAPLMQDAGRKILLCAFWVALVFVALLRWTSLTPASQGRLMFPCIAVISAALAYGWWTFHRYVLIGACAGLVALAIAAPFAFIAPAYAQPPDRWVQRLPLAVNADFGGVVRLEEAGFDESGDLHPGDEVTLHLSWALAQPVTRNYSVFVHLIDAHDVIVAQRDMYPGQGSLALSEQPAGRLWSDRYTLRLSPLTPAPKQLRWAVGLYDHATGERLPLANGDDRAIFGSLELVSRPDETPLLRYANGLELLGYALDPPVLAPGATLTVTTRWRAAGPLPSDLNVSLQLLDDGANKIAQQDLGQPLTQWRASEAVTLTHTLAVSDDATPGVYRLLLVWYAPDDFARLSAYDAQGQFAGDQITLTRLRVR
ncbi:MAG: glycosyltransferase family 39 protein [Candidatus Brachytrichaceae bacterium NZ_4S206]